MIESIYIDNFRCLSRFELQLDCISLFMGTNGTGKSTVFDALERLRRFVVGGAPCREAFPLQGVTRWEAGTGRLDKPQTFRLQITSGANHFDYRLRIAHESVSADWGETPHVRSEYLGCNGECVYSMPDKDVLPITDQPEDEPEVDMSRSAIGPQAGTQHDERVLAFRQRMARLIIARVNPFAMSSDATNGAALLSIDLANFSGWYREQVPPDASAKTHLQTRLHEELGEMFEGYAGTFLNQDDTGRWFLQLAFDPPGAEKRTPPYLLDELSDGQRALIALYALVFFAEACGDKGEDVTLCIDEPDNFVALPEIEPWLHRLEDICADGPVQALLISHHPEMLDHLASSSGIWFGRERNGPVQTEPVADNSGTGLKISELYARGWLND